MGTSWDTAILGQVSFVTDFSANGSFADLRENVEYLSKPDYAILVRLLDFSRNWDGDFVYIPKRSYDFLRKCQLEVGDVIIANIGANAGTLFRVPDLGRPSALGPNALVIKTNKFPNTSKEFLYYYFTSPDGQNQIQSIITGSAQPKFTKTDLRNLKIPFPAPSEQHAIVGILGALDNKIELNYRMNRTLESMAQTVFRQWFVENDEAEGWKAGTLGEIADVIDCLHSKKPERQETGKPFLQLANILDNGLLNMTDVYYITESDYDFWISRIEASVGDCVITNVGRVGAVAQIPEGVKAALGRNMTAVRLKKEFPYPTFLIECLLSDSMRQEINNKTDSGTILNALNVKNIPLLQFPLPPHNLLKEFEKLTRPIRARMEQNLKESQTLASLRDTLLPKLMKGKVRVQDL